MVKIIKDLGFIIFFTILPGLVTLVGFLFPNLSLFTKTILILGTFFICILIVAIYLGIKQKNYIREINKLKQELGESQKINNDIQEFIHKRKLFVDHNMVEICDIITQYEGYVRDAGRGHVYSKVRDEARQVKERVLKIIREEKRDFDDQLYRVSRNKNN
ncbi:hypothetical protein M1D69_00150 [Bacillus sp. PK3-037]|nr:hypothetical protein C2H92_16505 [Bacillus halotolerans]